MVIQYHDNCPDASVAWSGERPADIYLRGNGTSHRWPASFGTRFELEWLTWISLQNCSPFAPRVPQSRGLSRSQGQIRKHTPDVHRNSVIDYTIWVARLLCYAFWVYRRYNLANNQWKTIFSLLARLLYVDCSVTASPTAIRLPRPLTCSVTSFPSSTPGATWCRPMAVSTAADARPIFRGQKRKFRVQQ